MPALDCSCITPKYFLQEQLGAEEVFQWSCSKKYFKIQLEVDDIIHLDKELRPKAWLHLVNSIEVYYQFTGWLSSLNNV